MPKRLADKMKRAARDLLLPLFDAADREALSPAERKAAREDPDFKADDDKFQAEVKAHQKEILEDERQAARDLKAKKRK